MKKIISLFTLTAALMAHALGAAELGQPAAPLKIKEWIKGKSVDLASAKGNQVLVVEFWATWCGPCRTSIPHLTELQKKFKDVGFIGVSDEDAPTVKKFVNKMGDQMDYTVAIDDDRQTSKGYMEAFDQNGIPHAFIVDREGRVVWQGHPMDGLEEALAEVVSGKFDLAKAKKRAGAENLMREFFEAAMEDKDDAKITKLGKELEALDAELGGLTPGRKFSADEVRKSAKFRRLLQEYQLAIRNNKSGTEVGRIEGLLKENAPEGFDLAGFKEAMQLSQTFSEYYMAASGRGSADKLASLGRKLSEVTTTNAMLLNEWAWTILTDERIKTRDYPLATKLAKAAVDASGAKDAGVLDTYARALFDSGKTTEGIEWQKKAVAAAEDNETRAQLGETLKQFQAKTAKQ
ncbi:MAG TPA: redoxin domain-containing protein [Verrucomicrobiae bacterium]|nr:redoxin domain-containing protein [Verrucomicrobiae bacterium]